MRRRVRAFAGLLGLVTMLFGLLVGSAVAAEQRGVAVDVGRIDVEEPIVPGSRYTLPPITVRNPGELTSTYRMVLQAIATHGGAATPDPTWLTFAPATFELAPGQRQQVAADLEVSPAAPPGAYQALLSAQLVNDADGARVGAAAAAQLTFTVPTPTGLAIGSSWWRWLLVGALGGALLLLVRRTAGRYTVRIQRR